MDLSFTAKELRLCQDLIVSLVIDAGKIVDQAFNSRRKGFVEKNCRQDLVTETDTTVEKFLISRICEKFPSHRFIGEESSAQSKDPFAHLTDEPTWMIDPIDGTMNFVHGFPHICISVALVARKVPILGVIYNPVLNELYTARLGGGAYKNGCPIKVSNVTDISKSLLATDFGAVISQFMDERVSCAGKLVPLIHGIRAVGSSALHMVMVASGTADAMYEVGLHCWDMAAGTIIVKEAGGTVIDANGNDLDLMSRRVLCTATPQLANEIASHMDVTPFKFTRD